MSSNRSGRISAQDRKDLACAPANRWTLEPLLHISMGDCPWGQSKKEKTMASKKRGTKHLKKSKKLEATKPLAFQAYTSIKGIKQG
jgi:hypothetical protein